MNKWEGEGKGEERRSEEGKGDGRIREKGKGGEERVKSQERKWGGELVKVRAVTQNRSHQRIILDFKIKLPSDVVPVFYQQLPCLTELMN